MANILYKETERFENLPFDEYLNLDCYSHSSLKNMKNGLQKDFVDSDKIAVGRMCDAILTGGDVDITSKYYDVSKKICFDIKGMFGAQIKSFKNQVSYLSKIEDAETSLSLMVSGRLDWELGKLAVIDLKINNSCRSIADCFALIDYMGYDNQVYHYARNMQSFYETKQLPKRYIAIYSTKIKDLFLAELKSEQKPENWWKNKVLEYGKVY